MHLRWDVPLYKEIWGYVGWNAVGTFAFMANGQGVTILLNIFFSTVVNAARGIASSVSSQVSGFVINFQTAVRPQIFKLYAVGDYEKMNQLICNSAKYSSYLLMLVGLPVFIKTEFLIKLWLGNIPEYVVPFIKLTLIELFFRAIDFPIGDGIHAFGKMKLPNLTSSFAYLSILPLTYVCLKMGATPITSYIVACFAFPMALACDLWILNKYSGFDIKYYLIHVPLKTLALIVLASILPYLLANNMEEGWLNFIVTSSVCCLSSALLVFFIGLDSVMRKKVVFKIKSRLGFKRDNNE